MMSALRGEGGLARKQTIVLIGCVVMTATSLKSRKCCRRHMLMAPKGRRWTSAATSKKKKKKPKEGGVVVVVTDMTDADGDGEDDEGDFVSRARKGK